MRALLIAAAGAIAAALLMPSFAHASGSCAGMTPGQLTSLNGFVPFQGTGSLWNADISSTPVDPNSANIINFIGAARTLHADFGSGLYAGQSIGIPYQIVSGTQIKVPILLGLYADESDPGSMPIPKKALIEGYPKPGSGDRHLLVLDKDGCWLYELYNAQSGKHGSWDANSSAVWDMTADELRPYTWTSADAAGLPIFAGLARYDELAAGVIQHALRFTVPVTRQAFVAPASHWASSNTDPNAPPMGTRMRLKTGFDITGFSPANQVILTAMKKYGIILADNGSSIFISGAPDNRWDNSDLHNLGKVTAADFDVIQMGAIYRPGNVPNGPAPMISSFAAQPTKVSRGKPVTLSFDVTDSEYNIISPKAGPVRGNSVVVTPSSTTSYTLYSTNQYGRTSASVKVTVQ